MRSESSRINLFGLILCLSDPDPRGQQPHLPDPLALQPHSHHLAVGSPHCSSLQCASPHAKALDGGPVHAGVSVRVRVVSPWLHWAALPPGAHEGHGAAGSSVPRVHTFWACAGVTALRISEFLNLWGPSSLVLKNSTHSHSPIILRSSLVGSKKSHGLPPFGPVFSVSFSRSWQCFCWYNSTSVLGCFWDGCLSQWFPPTLISLSNGQSATSWVIASKHTFSFFWNTDRLRIS